MTAIQFFSRYRHVSGAIALVTLLLGIAAAAQQYAGPEQYGRVEADIRSDYSHIKVRRLQNTFTLLFVRDNGEEVIETMVDLDRPHQLLIDYTKSMFLSYVHRPEQKKVLIVGLGGGSMIHFLKRYDPKLQVDVVEIDPKIVDLADKYFQVRGGGNLRIIEKDALKYLAETAEQYDVIYMDAFLKPSPDTDPNGVPLALKTAQFYQQLQKKLTPGGLVVFNLNPHAGSREDIAGIAKSFRQTYVYRLPGDEGFVVVGATSADRDSAATVYRQATELDRRFNPNFRFERLARNLQR